MSIEGSTHIDDDCWVENGRVVSADSTSLPSGDDSVPELRGLKIPPAFENYTAVITIDWEAQTSSSGPTWGYHGGTPPESEVSRLTLSDARLVLCPTPRDAMDYIIRGSAEHVITLDPPVARALFRRYYQQCMDDASNSYEDVGSSRGSQLYDRERLGESDLSRINAALKKAINEAGDTPEEFIAQVGKTWQSAAKRGYLQESVANAFIRKLVDVAAGPDAALRPLRSSLPRNYHALHEDAQAMVALKAYSHYWLANKVIGERLQKNVALSEAIQDTKVLSGVMDTMGFTLLKPNRVTRDDVMAEDVEAIASHADASFDPFIEHLIKLAESKGLKVALR